MPYFSTADNTSLYYEIHGQGQPLVLIHGLGSSTLDWQAQVDEFSKQYKVISMDVRGHGRSDKPAGPYSVSLFTNDIYQLLKSITSEPAHILGMSMGGWIALQLAVDYPHSVKSLIVVNASAELRMNTMAKRLELFKRLLLFRLLSMETIGRVLSKKLFTKPDQQVLRDTFIERWAKNDKRAYMAALKGAVGWSVVQNLPNIKQPTLFLSAEHDYTPLSEKQHYAAKMPNAKVQVIEGTRHALPVEKPGLFNSAVLAMLRRLT